MPNVTATFPDFFLSQGKDRQAIINGNMQVWQRGESFHNPPNKAFIVDRFNLSYNGSLIDTDVGKYVIPQALREQYNLPFNALSINNLSAPTGQTSYMFQTRIPDVSYGSGRVVSIGFWAWADRIINAHDMHILQNFGTGGVPSSNVYTVLTSTIQLTTIPKYYEFSVLLPSIDGKRIGSDGNDYLKLYHNIPRNAECRVFYTGFQMNLGSQVLPVIHESYDKVLADCQRFYERVTYKTGVDIVAGHCFDTEQGIFTLKCSPKWRDLQDVRLSDIAYFGMRSVDDYRVCNSITVGASKNTPVSSQFMLKSSPASFVANSLVMLSTFTADAYIEFDAEL